MISKLDKVRLSNLAAAIDKAEGFAHRLELTDDPAVKELARSMLSRLEDMAMEIGMELAETERTPDAG